MDISSVLFALADIERAILVDDGVDFIQTKRVYAEAPKPSTKLVVGDLPCWINTFTFDTDVRGPFGVGTLTYRITASLFMGEAAADEPRHIRQGRKMHTAFVAALRLNETLSGTATAGHDLRGGDPTEGITPWASVDYVSYVHVLTVPMWESANFALGI